MPSENDPNSTTAPENGPANSSARTWTARDIETILRQRGWLKIECDAGLEAWLAEAAALLSRSTGNTAVEVEARSHPEAEQSREALADLMNLIFQYDAEESLARIQSHIVLARAGSRAVIRELANRVLEGPEIDSNRYKLLLEGLEQTVGFSGRGLLHPVRLALAGRAGEDELDGVILLIDRAAGLPFAVAVKSTRQRILEFCAAMD
ncbi:MAG: hypothetical protein ACRD4K_05225 [Candidatus Acidiferrales bacterium]